MLVNFLLFQLLLAGITAAHLSPIHYTISRRGGSFHIPGVANLTSLLEELQKIEARFAATTRAFEGNTVVRKPRHLHGTQASTVLLGEVGREGNWFATLELGEPAQRVQMDLDMLTKDFYVKSTQSSLGSFFLDFMSKTYKDSEQPLPFPTCRQPTDILHLNTIERMIPVSFAHCRPSKQWIQALLPSGAYLGLAPAASLSQLNTTSLLSQLIEKGILDTQMWSLVLLNGRDGLFSLGGTPLASIRKVEKETQDLLASQKQEGHEELKREEHLEDRAAIYDPSIAGDPDRDWKWMQVRGIDGFWQIQMHGVWVDGVKNVFNQPAVLDINTPFILAPPMAARTLYSKTQAKRLPPPYDQFHAYPCLRPPQLHLDFAGWGVEVLKGRNKETFAPGGRFSLGRMAEGSGYCIGMIVESRMGLQPSNIRDHRHGGVEKVSGLGDVWILGEPFFRDVQVAFDVESKKVGLQRV
ncbi:hypothetical protein HYFRA_00000101 [Hymenoscyphus fraxineus]|uniref:Peptidase A1 domain-containing protein n=1 Tax=Hymenoscyphus fraxineus TaxID=746836 RepID=A0A9N9L426_9HELO|nr:hypothetical protein HYFRA_00000101 [Hymenoscyphus fraxineus]